MRARIGTSSIDILSSTGSCGRSTFASIKCWARSRADSVTVQNRDGLSTQPICTAAGTTKRVGSPGAWGRTYAKLKQSSSLTTSRQKPLLMSNFENKMCRPGGVSHMYCRRRESTFPISFTGIDGAVSTVVSLTLFCVIVTSPSTSWYTGKERSRIIRPRRPTCGINATGDILRFAGLRRLTSSQSITLQNPALTWYAISSLKSSIAAGVHAVGWGPRSIAASMTPHSQSGPQSTAMPCHHSCMTGVNGCTSANGCGCINERSLPFAGSGQPCICSSF